MLNQSNNKPKKNKHSLIERFIDYFFFFFFCAFSFFVIIVIVLTYPLPYYVFISGGITDLSSRFKIENAYKQKGSYNLSYVNQLNGNFVTYLASFVMPNWRVIDVENYQISETETIDEIYARDRLALISANQTATMLAYEKAGKEIHINDTKLYVRSAYDIINSTEKIKIGDVLVSIDDIVIDNFEQVSTIIKGKNVGDKITFEFKRDNDLYKTDVIVQEANGVKLVGLGFYVIYDYEVAPKIEYNFKSSESGSSAGLMTTLAIYDSLIPEDLTHGLKIAGTGTIDSEGNVGEIGGIEYKISGAEQGDADIFFAPSGDNYKDALKEKEKYNYKIKIIEVSTLDDAIDYLKNLKS